MEENIKIVDTLLEGNSDVFVKHNSQNPLEIAILRKNVKIAESLLNYVASHNSAPHCGRQVYESQLVFTACSKGCDELVELFLHRDSEIPIDRTEKTKLLSLACQFKRASLVKLLGKHEADINAEANGRTALEEAVDRRNLATVKDLLEFCPDINRTRRILRRALEGCYKDDKKIIVDVLLRYGFNIRPEEADDGELLKDAIKWKCLEIVDALLNNGFDVNVSCECLQGSTFLHVATENRRFEVAKFLIEHGADVNITDENSELPPIYTAVSNLDVDITRLLLSRGAVIENMHDLLLRAFKLNGMEMVEILLQHDTKFDINAILSNGRTVLLNLILLPIAGVKFYTDFSSKQFITENIHKAKMAEVYLRRGAIVDLKSTNGHTPLYAAIRKRLSLVVEKLLEYGAEVDAKNEFDRNATPLMVAVGGNDLNIVQNLIRFLPDSEIRDSQGKTALHYAVKLAGTSIVQYLMDYGADINATAEDDTTPYTCNITKEVKVVLERHIHKMKALNLYVNSKNSERFNLNRNFYDACNREIEEMKCTKISNSLVSFYDVLTKGMPSLVNYVRNENIVNALNMRDRYAKKFPMYSAMLYRRFVKSSTLEPLLTAGEQSLNALIGCKLPYLASMQLLCYLNMKDLKNLIKASTITD